MADESPTPLRRLFAAEMLDIRLHNLRWEADQRFRELSEGQTDRDALLTAIEAADVEPRVLERLLVLAESWQP